MTDIMICFNCGENFEGEGTLCPSCVASSRERLERAKAKKHLKRGSCLDQFMQALGVVIALLML